MSTSERGAITYTPDKVKDEGSSSYRRLIVENDKLILRSEDVKDAVDMTLYNTGEYTREVFLGFAQGRGVVSDKGTFKFF